MDNIKHFFKKLFTRSPKSEQGQGLVEYAIILIFVGIATVAIVQVMGPTITNTFDRFVRNAPVAPPSLVNYTPPPTFTPTATTDPNATATNTPSGPIPSATFEPTETPVESPTPTSTSTSTPTSTPTPTNTATPSSCQYAPAVVPANGSVTVQAENFMCGGQNNGYYDYNSSPSNSCTNYRVDENPSGVDLENSGDDGTCSIGYIADGEWTKYEVNATSSQQHYFTLRIASEASGRVMIRVTNQYGDQQTNTLTLPVTGGWATWTDYIVDDLPISLDAGSTNIIEIYTAREGYNLNYFTISTSPPATPVPEGILFVVGNTSLNSGDQAVYNRLQNQGHSVILVDDSASSTADATGKQLVIISSTSNSNSVAAKFREVNVPVIVWEYAIFEDMYMVDGTGRRGRENTENEVKIRNTTHPLTNGFNTNDQIVVVTTNNSQRFSWGNPSSGADAIEVTVMDNSNSKATIFAYDTGKVMDDGNNTFVAPARRVGLFFTSNVPQILNSDGWRLFDNAVNWALGNT